MGRDQDCETFEWVNRWVANAVQPAPVSSVRVEKVIIARIAPMVPKDQLKRDVAEIERARNAIDARAVVAGTGGKLAVKTQRQALARLSRTTDPVPVMVGGLLALVMLTVFGAAAAMGTFSR